VTDIGLCSTDVVYFAAGKLDAPGAMFTASHNPAQYNGIKLCRAGAAPVGDHVRSFVDTSVLRPLTVVADTANGMGGLVVPKVFEGLPFTLTVLYGEL